MTAQSWWSASTVRPLAHALAVLTLLIPGLVAGCGDETGPSGNTGTNAWSGSSGRFRLEYMSGAQPPWRYVDPGGSIGTDVDSVMLHLHPDGRYAIEFYLQSVTARPTYNGYWAPSGGQLTFLPLPHGKGGSLTTGQVNGNTLTISTVGHLMPGLAFPNGAGTAFQFKHAGHDTEVVDSFVQARLLEGSDLTGAAVAAGDVVLSVSPGARELIRSGANFQMPVGSSDGGAQPRQVVVAGDGRTAYVSEGDAGQLGIVDVATGTTTGTVPLRGTVVRIVTRPGAIFALTGSYFGIDTLYRVDPATHSVTARVSVQADAMAVSDDGSRVYVGSGTAGVQEFDGTTLDSLRTFAIPASAAMALSEDGATLYVGHDGRAVEGWDLATATRTMSIPVAGDIYEIARQPGTGELYVSRAQATGGGSVYRINPADPTDQAQYNTGGLPRYIAFTASGNAVVANAFGWIDILR